jgi:DNA-binding transcriptional LysR family regulator
LEAILAPAAVRFVEQYPKVSIQLQGGSWDDLLRLLRSRELDFFVAETSTLHRDPDLEVVPMPSQHPAYLFARASHPLAARERIEVSDAFTWPFATPSRIPPRVLDPMLAAHRSAVRHGGARPFPAIQCTGMSTLKRIVKDSDAVGGSILPCIADELESGTFVLLSTAPWLHLHYGIVSLKGRPRTQASERFREIVLECEEECTRQEATLAKRFQPGQAREKSRRSLRRT